MFNNTTLIVVSIFMLLFFVHPVFGDAINADRMVGIAPVTVKFNLDSENWSYYQEWSFGDGTTINAKDPAYVFTKPGSYQVKVSYRNALGKFELVRENFITVYPPSGLVNLKIVDNSTSWPSENWENAVDGDLEGEDALVSAMGEPAFAIFSFSGSDVKKIKQIRLLGNAGIRNRRNRVSEAKIEISVSGTNSGDFQLLTNVVLDEEKWTDLFFNSDSARYIKLTLTCPTSDLKQLSEFEVYTEFEPVASLNSTIDASAPHEANGVDFSEITLVLCDENGQPITGKTLDDVSFYIGGRNNYLCDFREVAPGVYKMNLTSLTAEEKKVVAFINGIPVAYTTVDQQTEATTLFTQPPSKAAQLVVVDSSATWPREGWSKAFDGRYSGEGTYASSTGNPPFVVVEFVEKTLQWINHFKIKTRAEVGAENHNHWVKQITLFVSKTGLNAADFEEIFVAEVNSGEWLDFNFSAIPARYLKFVVNEPRDSEWRQISEIQVTAVSAPTPVELAAFDVVRTEKAIRLQWITLSESKNYGFEIQRRTDVAEFVPVAFVQGKGTTVTRNSYSYLDTNIKPEKYYYRLKQIDFDGTISFSAEKAVIHENLKSFQLGANFPNPFNPTTRIQYLVGTPGIVKISIKNLLGQEIKELVNQKHEIGDYEIYWDATDRFGQSVASGTYLYLIETDNFREARRMVLIR
jgi:PKD repeat protein